MNDEAAHSGADEVRRHAIALYTFLKEFTELRSKTVRSVDEYEVVLWLADVPREPECDTAAWSRGRIAEDAETWLTVRQPRLLPPPQPPLDLQPWLRKDQVADSSLAAPELREEISGRVRDPGGGERVERRVLAEHPEVRAAWQAYIEAHWRPWAESDRRGQAVQRVYADLFSIYQKQQRLGEQYEVVLGLGLLSWRTPDSQEIRRHLVVGSANVAFDSARGVITVGPAGDGAHPQLEQDMLDPKLRPDPEELRSLEDQVNAIGDQIWEVVPIDSALSSWVHSASPKGGYSDDLSPPERSEEDPRVHLAPALILRKRTDRSFLKAFEEIIRQIKAGAQVPPGVTRFVTVAEDPGKDEGTDSADSRAQPPSDVYFPLESNEAQRRIVERLETNQGVLVQGPPGTGKSHTIVNLICHLLASGKRVLVTSHTARALRVLQKYIKDRATEISPLSVVLLGDDRDSLQAMEDSVQGITARHNSWDRGSSERKIHSLEAELDGARREEASALAYLRSVRERETYLHPPRPGGYEGTLQSIASRLRREEDTFDWIEDRPSETAESPLGVNEFRELREGLRDPEINRWLAKRCRPVDVGRLPSLDSLLALMQEESDAREASASTSAARQRPNYSPLSNAPEESRKRLGEEIEALLLSVDQISRHLHPWVGPAVREILGDHDRAWRELLAVSSDHLACIGTQARWADETAVSFKTNRDHHEIRADAAAMASHLKGGGSWGIGPFRAATAKRALYLKSEVTLGGRGCDTPESLKHLIAWLDIENRLRILRERWDPFHRVASPSFSSQVREFEDLCEPLTAALGLHQRVARIRAIGQSISGFAEPTWHDLGAVRELLDIANAVDAHQRLQRTEGAMSRALADLRGQLPDGSDPAALELIGALETRSPQSLRSAFALVAHNCMTHARLRRREELLATLRQSAPLLAEQLVTTAHDSSWDSRSTQFEAAWNWARTMACVERLSDPEAEQQARLQLDSARDRIRKRLSMIAAERAWAHCFARMTEHERQHLVAWSKAVRSIGKGTGRYAPQHRRSAREHLNECRSAIPAWVMPLYRVAETIKPGSDLFDVVIIDEASQSGPEALLLAYLAKKLVVVGDDKQISPTYPGIDHEDVNLLRSRHISSLPHSDAYGVQQSFFDLAEIRYQGRVRLREHFRCMPEIIQFSNNLCYASEPLIPLRQYGGSRLLPIVSARHVPDGYLKGSGHSTSNPPEAQALVDELVRLSGDELYEGKTFGVISLLGETQAKEIESLLLQRLGAREIERRHLVCGDAYAFQGDERDVMFLSLVSAPGEGRRIGTLADEASRRRFNVAASRARDRLLLFHSASLSDLSPHCLRHALLRYCQAPKLERQVVGGVAIADLQLSAERSDRSRVRQPDPFGSWFEVDVFLQLAARGFRVIPQYEIAGKRIDLLVEGMKGRLAVECDGDQWHGPDRYDEDMARQRDLERCGLRFWRVRGSAYALDPHDALEDLWDTLARAGIQPGGAEDLLPSDKVAEGVKQPAGQVESRNSSPTAEAVRSENSRSSGRGESLPPPLSDNLVDASDPGDSEDHEELPQASPESRLPDPTVANPSDLVPGLVEIVRAEGPMVVERLYRAFVIGAGRQRVGRHSRSALNKALWRAIREGVIEERNETGRSGLRERVLRAAGSPPIVVRPRGDRDLTPIRQSFA